MPEIKNKILLKIMRQDIINQIFKLAKEKNAFDELEKYLFAMTKQELSENIIQCGTLPEMFDHDR